MHALMLWSSSRVQPILDVFIHISFIVNAYDPDAVTPHRVKVVFRLIKWAFVALSIFAIVTASDEQQGTMMAGARAFGGALLTACSREGSPCTTVIGVVKAQVVDAWQTSRDQPREQGTSGNARYQLSPKPPRDELTYSRKW
jgi:hypothetical protein